MTGRTAWLAKKRGCEVDRNGFLEVGAREIAELLVRTYAGVVDEDVDPAESFAPFFDHSFRSAGFGEIENTVFDASRARVLHAFLPRQFELGCGPLGDQKHRRASLGKPLCDGIAYPVGS